jgi:hypothetical protein
MGELLEELLNSKNIIWGINWKCLDYATDCTIVKWTDVQQRPAWLLAKVTSHFLSVGVLFLSVDCGQLAGSNIMIWREKMASFLVLSMKKSQLSRTNDRLSRTSESPHPTQPSLSVADSR